MNFNKIEVEKFKCNNKSYLLVFGQPTAQYEAVGTVKPKNGKPKMFLYVEYSVTNLDYKVLHQGEVKIVEFIDNKLETIKKIKKEFKYTRD